MNRPRHELTVAFLVVALSCGGAAIRMAVAAPDAECANLEAIAWILGDWRTEAGKNVFTEHWARGDDGSFVGYANAQKEGDEATSFEKLRLEERADGLYFVADVAANEKPVDFKLVDCKEDSFRFENPEHDFPQVIKYLQLEGGGIEAQVQTLQGQGFVLRFRPHDSP